LLIDGELALWKKILSKQDFALFKKCFKLKMCKHGWTRHGLEFVFHALRCSGETDTWLGNTILNWIAHRYFEKVNNLPKYNFVVTGDDGNGAFPRNLDPSTLINTFPMFGFDCKLRFISDPLELEFCSCKYVEYSPGCWMLCPNIPKLLRNIGLMKNVDFANCVGHYYYSLGYMYKVMFPGCPFFTQLSAFLMRLTKNPKVRFVNIEHFKYLNPMYVEVFRSGTPNVQISQDLFMTGIQMAYGLMPSDLAQIYAYFDEIDVDLAGMDNRFNRKGTPSPMYSSRELAHVEEYMRDVMLQSSSIEEWEYQVSSYAKAGKIAGGIFYTDDNDKLVFSKNRRHHSG
jgi:hypothetical protein